LFQKKNKYIWDEDFKEGKVVESLDENTELYEYTIKLMPPHPSRDFSELRHTCNKLNDSNTIILTSTSVNQLKNEKQVGHIRANTILSKYIIEKLISTEAATTFKITHFIQLDYKYGAFFFTPLLFLFFIINEISD